MQPLIVGLLAAAIAISVSGVSTQLWQREGSSWRVVLEHAG